MTIKTVLSGLKVKLADGIVLTNVGVKKLDKILNANKTTWEKLYTWEKRRTAEGDYDYEYEYASGVRDQVFVSSSKTKYVWKNPLPPEIVSVYAKEVQSGDWVLMTRIAPAAIYRVSSIIKLGNDNWFSVDAKITWHGRRTVAGSLISLVKAKKGTYPENGEQGGYWYILRK